MPIVSTQIKFLVRTLYYKAVLGLVLVRGEMPNGKRSSIALRIKVVYLVENNDSTLKILLIRRK